MKLQTVRVRRSRPSALSLAIALMITMAFVYLISLSAAPEADDAAVQFADSADVHMEGLSIAFVCENRFDSLLEARVAAAKCAQDGGAGLILAEAERYAVVREAVSADGAGEGAFVRAADGLTLRLSGPADEIRAVADAVDFLRAQASETGSLAHALESGDTNAASIAALLNVYRTQGARALDALARISAPEASVARIQSAVQSALNRLDDAAKSVDAGRVRLIHAAACAEWIRLLTELAGA